jgi:hypothetical protein
MTDMASGVDGLGYDSLSNALPNPGLLAGRRWNVLGQTANTASGNVANQGAGTVALPTLAANTVGTVAVNDAVVTANSLIFLVPKLGPLGDTTAARGIDVWIESVAAGTFTLGYKSEAAMANPWACHYWAIN